MLFIRGLGESGGNRTLTNRISSSLPGKRNMRIGLITACTASGPFKLNGLSRFVRLASLRRPPVVLSNTVDIVGTGSVRRSRAPEIFGPSAVKWRFVNYVQYASMRLRWNR
jgi:hypothetical protein